MAKIPENLKYSKDHEWVLIDGDTAVVGITDHAQDALGEVVYVELPEVGDTFEADEEISNIESVKAASPIITPVGGEVSEVNESLDGEPEQINKDCYGAYIYKMTNITVPDNLLSAAEYEKFLAEEA